MKRVNLSFLTICLLCCSPNKTLPKGLLLHAQIKSMKNALLSTHF